MKIRPILRFFLTLVSCTFSFAEDKNIIFFITDDQSPTLGCYGDPIAKTPAIDALAADGTLFSNAFATTASCSASRSVVMSGLHNHANGQYGHQHSFHKFSSYFNVIGLSLPRNLSYAGYRTGHIGKYHVSPEEVFRFETYLKGNPRNAVQMAEQTKEFITAESEKPFFLYLPLPAPHTPIVPVPPYKDASKMNPYADFVMQIDGHMGELIKTLKDAGVDDNTLVFFTSDNGCSPEGNFAKLKEFGHDPSAGYRGHKADVYEGGHRVPFIARWPKGIKPGQKTSVLACLTDLYETMREITGQPKKDEGGEDSFSLLPAFKGKGKTSRSTLVSHSIGGSFSIRKGDWKLCLSAGSGGWSAPREGDAKKKKLPPMQLFNLKDDRGERKNLLTKKRSQANALILLLNGEVERGRSSPGNPVSNDRKVTFLPAGVKMPEKK